MKTYIPKEHQDIPDFVALKIHYVTGQPEIFEIGWWSGIKNGIFEFVTQDNIHHWVIVDNVKRFEWDKNFSKIIELKNEKEKDKTQK